MIEANDDELDGGQVIRLEASAADKGKRLDAFLAQHEALAGLSRSRIAALIKAGAVALGSETIASPSQKIAGAVEIVLRIPEAEEAAPQGEPIPLFVLYEDEDLIVIDKPAGLVVHPGPGNASGTLVNALIHHCGTSLSGIGGVKRPGLVHRLDKDTSGVMVVAKTDTAHRHLAAQFADHGRTGALERAYLALCWGAPPKDATIDAPLGRDPKNRLKMAVVSTERGGREAITHMQRLALYGDPDNPAAAKVRCHLETGRTHQIRVHLAEIGHGVIGDPDYGRGNRTKANLLSEHVQDLMLAFPRQALHAAKLVFEHPKTNEIKVFETKPPDDFRNLEATLDIPLT